MTTIRITTVHGDVDVEAHVYGAWAAHRSYGRHGWSMTHVDSGRRLPVISRVMNEPQAQAVAEALAKHCDGVAWVGLSRTDDPAEATAEMMRAGEKVRDVALEALRSARG